MTLELQNISKSYGDKKILDDISIVLKPGEIVGLVGVNGVGKTTLLKIMAGLIAQYSGTISRRAHIGYLSERNPLYPEMYVTEYLNWLKRIGKNRRSWPLLDLMKKVGIQEVAAQKIRTLSKGYRQRVGLAAAILHQPEILLLDEPINGLDPVQINEYHQLIRSIRQDRIIILSSHLIHEIEALCDRVLKLEATTIVTDKYLDQSKTNLLRIQVRFENEVTIAELNGIVRIASIKEIAKSTFIINADEDEDPRSAIFDYAVSAKNRILEMKSIQDQLEQLF